jgi:CubicO group peptidase (beta-lactamase class C family)
VKVIAGHSQLVAHGLRNLREVRNEMEERRSWFWLGAIGVTSLILMASFSTSLFAQAKTASATSAAPRERLRRADVEEWADPLFGSWVRDHRVSALAIVVTQGDHVVFIKGYGYADWATKTPVNPQTSQFRIASLTKTFTATAVAQLLQLGKIASLNDPVNKYLKRIQLPKNAGQDITVWDLLTHRPGFADFPLNKGNVPTALPVPGSYINALMPGYDRPRDTLSIYSNFGVAMLGVMVEDITGETLPVYIQEHIFKPLGMANSVLTDARTAGPNVVRQYAFRPNEAPIPLPYPVASPILDAAGDINSTAADMAKWIVAHIEEGHGPGPAILSPKYFHLMHRRHAGNDPRMSGFGMNFFVYNYNGEKILEHYGSLKFRSLELMLMKRKIGIFVTMGGGGEPGPSDPSVATAGLLPISGPVEKAISHSGARAAILEHFLGKLPFRRDTEVNTAQYTGTYYNVASYGSDRTGNPVNVAASGDGGLVINGIGVYRFSGKDMFTLDGTLPLDTGFGFSTEYVFVKQVDGSMRMFGEVNAGGYERKAEKGSDPG